ncbi:MAG: GtrA family protein [Chloroflexi bacterium]|nr:GtrA family protein [Chloroflexota bacterium]
MMHVLYGGFRKVTAFFDRVNALAPQRVREAHPEVKRFIKFAIVGGIGAVLDVAVLNFMILVVGLPKGYANLISVLCAIISNFTWNRLWTFPESREHAVHSQFGKFALVNLIGLGINQAVFLLTDHFVFLPLLPRHETLAYNLAKLCAIGVVLFWNFGMNRIWTYRHVEFGAEHKHALLEDEIPPL